MPSWPTAVGGMLMAGYAASQAQKAGLDSPTALVASALKTLGNGDAGYSPSASGRLTSNTELTVLQGEVDRLHKLLADVVRGQKGGGYTVIHTGRGGWSYLVLPTLAAGGVLYVYVKIRGVTISDFFMVTNKSLQQFRDLVSQSMTQLWEELRKQKDEFLSRLRDVGSQQQELMRQQGEMDEKLQAVSANVEEIRDVSNVIEARVGQMDHNINIMSTGVQRANEGIYLLCAMVADVSRRIGMDSSRLKNYVQSTPLEITDSNAGLRTLLEGFASGDATPALAASTSTPASIMEVPEEAELQLGGDGSAGAGPRLGANRPGTEDMRLLYRRDSAPAMASGRGLMSGLWGGGGSVASTASATNPNGNRSRVVANGH